MTEVARFVGSIPELYERHLGPVLFEPYAIDLASRVPAGSRKILEIAAGTGRVTRRLLEDLPADGELVVTDLNQPMLDIARELSSDPRITWQQADAESLPFTDDASFDAVVCQFGIMFIPDKPQALSEMNRVLRPGGTLLLNVWDELAKNPMTRVLHELASAEFPNDPPIFMLTPFSMPDPAKLKQLIEDAGFSDVKVETVPLIGVADSAEDVAIGLVKGNPLWTQLVDRGVDAPAFQAKVAEALRREFGDNPCRSALSAHVATAVA
jgi:ubiquinone/menaquinone biosynthesis C-methylase UbiE